MRTLIVLCLALLIIFVACQDKPVTNDNSLVRGIDGNPGTNNIADQIEYYSSLECKNLNEYCQKGILKGYWIRDDIFAFTGDISGVMYEKNSEPFAYYDGEFWKTNDGNQYFYASISGYYTDQVMGFMFGTWYYDDPRLCPLCGSGHGQYNGYLVLYENDNWGKVSGEFGDYALPLEQDSLPMIGDWKTICHNTDNEIK